MSRVGNAPVSIPDGVTLTIDADVIKVKGSNGELQKKIPSADRRNKTRYYPFRFITACWLNRFNPERDQSCLE